MNKLSYQIAELNNISLDLMEILENPSLKHDDFVSIEDLSNKKTALIDIISESLSEYANMTTEEFMTLQTILELNDRILRLLTEKKDLISKHWQEIKKGFKACDNYL